MMSDLSPHVSTCDKALARHNTIRQGARLASCERVCRCSCILVRLSAPPQHVRCGRREARSQAGRGRSTRPTALAHEVSRLVAPPFALCLVRLDVSRISAPIKCLAAPIAVGDGGVKNHKGGDAAGAVAERVLLIRRVEAVHTCRGLTRICGVELHFHAGRAIAAVIISVRERCRVMSGRCDEWAGWDGKRVRVCACERVSACARVRVCACPCVQRLCTRAFSEFNASLPSIHG